ncbi:unnamed protein product [Trichogramma brassicae]|uniref:Uncharacterized protein n=1 Tax=Trichogramma brassicae TaxID=86971 RepID=A0A6H5J1E4_9HYME|nr:unnamed protein product [Trichogramma brassicae]
MQVYIRYWSSNNSHSRLLDVQVTKEAAAAAAKIGHMHAYAPRYAAARTFGPLFYRIIRIRTNSAGYIAYVDQDLDSGTDYRHPPSSSSKFRESEVNSASQSQDERERERERDRGRYTSLAKSAPSGKAILSARPPAYYTTYIYMHDISFGGSRLCESVGAYCTMYIFWEVCEQWRSSSSSSSSNSNTTIRRYRWKDRVAAYKAQKERERDTQLSG